MDSPVHILKTAAKFRFIKMCALLIIDGLGYLPVSRTEANFFFALFSQLCENTSIIITSIKGFGGWADILGDSVLPTTLPDRITHKSQVLSFVDNGGNSTWRFAHRKQIFYSFYVFPLVSVLTTASFINSLQNRGFLLDSNKTPIIFIAVIQ
jgi:hypothetical protein